MALNNKKNSLFYSRKSADALVTSQKAAIKNEISKARYVVDNSVVNYDLSDKKTFKDYSDVYSKLVKDLESGIYITKLLEIKKINSLATALVKDRLINNQTDYQNKPITQLSSFTGKNIYVHSTFDLFLTGDFYSTLIAQYVSEKIVINGDSPFVREAYSKNAYQFSEAEAEIFNKIVDRKIIHDINKIEKSFKVQITI